MWLEARSKVWEINKQRKVEHVTCHDQGFMTVASSFSNNCDKMQRTSIKELSSTVDEGVK